MVATSTDDVKPQLQQESLDFASQEPREYLGPNGSLHYFTSKRGQKIAAYAWPAESPRSVIHLLHGHGGYLCFDYLKGQGAGKLATYEGSWVQRLNQAGYSVCGIDVHGAGRSEGLRWYTASFDHYVDEVQQHIRLMGESGKDGFPPILPRGATPDGNAVPRFVLGGSMGGCLATMTALSMPSEVSGVILLAPMLSLEKVTQRGINRYLKAVSFIVSGLFPTWPCIKISKNTLYPELQTAYDVDPNCWHGSTRARNGAEYVRVTAELMHGGMERLEQPLIVFHGLQDDMCDLDGSKALVERAKSTDKRLVQLWQMWHQLVREPGGAGILADVVEWLDARTKGVSSAAHDSTALVKSLRAQAEAELQQLAKDRPDLMAKFQKTKAEQVVTDKVPAAPEGVVAVAATA